MKYEMVFGDQKRFNEQNNEMAEVMLWHDYLGPNFVSIKELSRMSLDGAIPHGSVILAMRRIIRAPTWTVADQNAGKLPEVGCRVNFCHKLNSNWRTGEIKYIDDRVVVIKADDVARPFVYDVERVEYKPIETPEEKAQREREEDEFVASVIDLASENQLMSCGFKDGVIAAYRKLKGGE